MFFYPDTDAYALLFLLYVFGKHDVTFVFTILLFAGFVTCIEVLLLPANCHAS